MKRRMSAERRQARTMQHGIHSQASSDPPSRRTRASPSSERSEQNDRQSGRTDATAEGEDSAAGDDNSAYAQQNERLVRGSAATDGNANSVDDSFLWTEEFHRSFASAIYEVGVNNSSPAVIHENMIHRDNANLTSERIKSKLQKYRNNRAKSKRTFLEEYDAFLQRVRAIEMAAAASAAGHGSDDRTTTTPNAFGLLGASTAYPTLSATSVAPSLDDPSPPLLSSMLPASVVLEMVGVASPTDMLFGGDVAAYLSYMTMKEQQFDQHRKREQERRKRKRQKQHATTIPIDDRKLSGPKHVGVDGSGDGTHDSHTSPSSAAADAGTSSVHTAQQNASPPSSSSSCASCATVNTEVAKQRLQRGAMEYMEKFAGTGISFPELTEQEKDSSLGVSLTFVMGLFLSMTQHLMQQRESGDDQVSGDLTDMMEHFVPQDNAGR